MSGILKLDDAGQWDAPSQHSAGDVPTGGELVGGPASALAPLWVLLGAALLGRADAQPDALRCSRSSASRR